MNKLKRIYIILANALRIFYLCLKKPEFVPQLEMLNHLAELMVKVVDDGQPYMTKIAVVDTKTETKQEIVSIWVGKGIGADPTERIAELIKENDMLKATIRKP